jgi:hypothetical protein
MEGMIDSEHGGSDNEIRSSHFKPVASQGSPYHTFQIRLSSWILIGTDGLRDSRQEV